MKILKLHFIKQNSTKTTQPNTCDEVIERIEKGNDAKECINAYLDIKKSKVKPGSKTDKAQEKLNKLLIKLSQKLGSSQNITLTNRYSNAINAVREIMELINKELSGELQALAENFNCNLQVDPHWLNDPNLLKELDGL